MGIGEKKRVARERIASEVAYMMERNDSNMAPRLALRALVRDREWDTVITLSHSMGVQISGNPRKFKSVVLTKLANKGCKTIW